MLTDFAELAIANVEDIKSAKIAHVIEVSDNFILNSPVFN